ncbi:MAG: 3'-5' exonuclease [bacterium]|nr:3'-5' exonuclease [bacterium]
MRTVYDTETTGLLKAEGTDIMLQPYITEIYAAQIDDSGKIVTELETLVKPPIPIPDFITKKTGISDYDVKDAPEFHEIYRNLVNVFFKSHTMIAHNLPFDLGMIVYELRRMGKEHDFPYPPMKFCTIEQSMHIKGHRLKNAELYEIATGKTLEDAHRAKNDVLATYESYKWLMENGQCG